MTTDFGFQQVDAAEKPTLVRGLFNRVAGSYDRMNDIMSLGLHRHWKNKFINLLPMMPGVQLLDVASGTGDIILRYSEKAQRLGMEYAITAYDCSENMLAMGRDRLINENMWQNVTWHQGMAENLPFLSDQYDLYTIAFGLRNVTDKMAALKEAYRVLKPKGGFYCLEFSHMDSVKLQQVYDFYSFKCIPTWGKLIAKDKDAYQYLVESIRAFPKAQELEHMIQEAGFKNVYHISLMGGIAAIHMGWKE